MPFDGNGNWTSPFFPIDDRDNGIPILASKFDELIQSNLKQSFPRCMTIDSQTKPIANVDVNNFKVINVTDPTLPKDAVNKQYLDGFVNNSTAGTPLNEDFIGYYDVANDENKKVTVLELTTYALPRKYQNEVLTYVDDSNITWQGEVRDDTNEFNIESAAAITINLPVPAASTTYYAFIGFDNNDDKNVIGEFDTDINGANLTNITGAKRRIGDLKNISFPTDSSSDLVFFSNPFDDFELDLWAGTATSGTITLNQSFAGFKQLYFIGQDTFFIARQYGTALVSDLLSVPNNTVIKAFSMGNNYIELTKVSDTQFTVFATVNINIQRIVGVK